MSEVGAYGARLGGAFGLENVPTLVTRSLRKTRLAVTELRYDGDGFGMTAPIPREDAYLIALQIGACERHALWNDDRPVRVSAIRGGETMIYDLRQNPIACMESPFHSLHFYVPRAALDAIADEAGAPRVDELDFVPGERMDDPIVRALAMCALTALENPERINQVFADHLLLALCAHVAGTYGHMRPGSRPRGGLAPWQEQRAKEMLSADLSANMSLATLAAECGLSVSHFTRAFRHSTGLPPHRWLLKRRVDRAMELLRDSSMSLAEIARAAGFADQSHFTRVFTATVGHSPGTVRRRQAAIGAA